MMVRIAAEDSRSALNKHCWDILQRRIVTKHDHWMAMFWMFSKPHQYLRENAIRHRYLGYRTLHKDQGFKKEFYYVIKLTGRRPDFDLMKIRLSFGDTVEQMTTDFHYPVTRHLLKRVKDAVTEGLTSFQQ